MVCTLLEFSIIAFNSDLPAISNSIFLKLFKKENALCFREQLLVVMLHVTSAVLDQNQHHSGMKHPDTLGYKLASALFQVRYLTCFELSYHGLEVANY